MDKLRGFLEVKRKQARQRPVGVRVKNFKEVVELPSRKHSRDQASRCMNCGTPFCHWGCPLGNYIPEWNDLVFRGQWERAFQLLDATNNLPEITGRLCPAQCEYACVLEINDDAVTIRENELAVVEYAFKKGLIRPHLPQKHTGKNVAVVGSGPAGLSCAAQLNKAGHNVFVFERDDKIGGILRYGIPDFKLEKWIIDRRLNILKKEGIKFITNVNIGDDIPVAKLLKDYDAICLSGGSRVPRDLAIEGRKLKGIHYAMDYLIQTNKRVADKIIPQDKNIDAKGKRVVVIGGGDTGANCVGIAHRQGAVCVVQIEIMPKPPECRTQEYPWPSYPMILKSSTSHEKGEERRWSILTKKFIGENGKLKKISCVKVEFFKKEQNRRGPLMKEISGSEFEIDTDLVILALGFIHPEHRGLIKELGVKLDKKGNVKTDERYMTLKKGIFSAGDMRRGQSLIVWAISEGRKAAHQIDKYLMGNSFLPFM